MIFYVYHYECQSLLEMSIKIEDGYPLNFLLVETTELDDYPGITLVASCTSAEEVIGTMQTDIENIITKKHLKDFIKAYV